MFSEVVWWVPVMAGLADAVNPPLLLTAAFFIWWSTWIWHKPLRRGKYGLVFLIIVYVLSLAFYLGIAQGFLYTPLMRRIIEAVYVFLGFLSIAGGVLLIQEWFRSFKADENGGERFWLRGSCSPLVAWVVTVLSAITLSILSSIWPMNFHMAIIANHVVFPGQFWATCLSVAIYTFFVLIPLFLMLFLKRLLEKNRSLFLMTASAIFLSGGIGAVYIFLIY